MKSLFKRCNHKWEVVTDTVLESPWQQFVKAVRSYSDGDGSMPMSMFEQTHILVQKCVKCGKLDKTVTRTLS